MILYEIESLKNIFGHLVTLSIPKVVKNGQKAPINAKYDIRRAGQEWCTFIVLYA